MVYLCRTSSTSNRELCTTLQLRTVTSPEPETESEQTQKKNQRSYFERCAIHHHTLEDTSGVKAQTQHVELLWPSARSQRCAARSRIISAFIAPKWLRVCPAVRDGVCVFLRVRANAFNRIAVAACTKACRVALAAYIPTLQHTATQKRIQRSP